MIDNLGRMRLSHCHSESGTVSKMMLGKLVGWWMGVQMAFSLLVGTFSGSFDSWSVVCAACCHVTLVFVVMHLYNILEFFVASVHSFFIFF